MRRSEQLMKIPQQSIRKVGQKMRFLTINLYSLMNETLQTRICLPIFRKAKNSRGDKKERWIQERKMRQRIRKVSNRENGKMRKTFKTKRRRKWRKEGIIEEEEEGNKKRKLKGKGKK